ncbi:hypothetical protein [Streptomyces sp. NPDC055243]|uniref:hypothetical protein n=1 Tax=Streptomyces sp. NPDC055243 TaxID=3365720 RepID=UPI0037D951A9
MSLDDERNDGLYGGSGETRTRLPEGEGGGQDGYGGGRRSGRSSSRSLVTVVGVVVVLIAAIAFANRGGEGSSSGGGGGDGKKAGADPTAATGEQPVDGKTAGIPSGFAKSEQGVQSAAANYASALGSDGMFNQTRRHQIVQTIADPSSVNKLQNGFDSDYSQAFLKKIGLNNAGSAPAGSTFVNRTLPAGTKIKSYSASSATVEVWCSGLFGLTGENSTNPVTGSWFTVTMKLKWSDDDWKVLDSSQKSGPTPVNGDNPISGADEIGEAVKEYGGFTYAR